jgi:hypothetical protein
MLKLFAWTKDFNPKSQQNSSAQVWVRLYGLSQEYWRPNIIFAIASSIGTPICTDATTAKPIFERTFGQFVRVLVDMDLTQTLRYKVLVERIWFAFFVELDYENLPAFCSNCKIIGHNVEECKRLFTSDDTVTMKEPKEKRNQTIEPKKVYVQKKDDKGKQSNPIIVNDSADKEKNNDGVETAEKQPVVEIEGQNKKTPPLVNNDGGNTQPIISNNSFAALGEQEFVEECSQKQLEDGNNKESEDDSQSTQEVGATQLSSTSKSVCSAGDSSQRGPADLELANVEFLKQSWANIAENDDGLENVQVMEKPLQPPFTLVTHRHNKKTQKSKSPKKSYDTRQKVGNLRPFK